MDAPRKMHVKRANAPFCFVRCKISAANLMITTTDFFNNDYRGAVMAEYVPPYGGSVFVSHDGLAYFFNRLLSNVFGDTTVYIKMKTEGKQFEIEARFNSTREIDPLERFRLSKCASNAGFEFYFSESGEETRVTLITELHMPKTLIIYSMNIADIKKSLSKYLLTDE